MDLQKVCDFIRERHYPINALADDLEISRQSLYMKLSGEREFRASELLKMQKVLRMSKDEVLNIFFNM